MLVFEVLEYDVRHEKRRTYWSTQELARAFVRSTYGAEVQFRPYHGDGPTGAEWFGRDARGDDAGIIEATWVWNRTPTEAETYRLPRLIRWWNEDSEDHLIRHLAELRGEDVDVDDDIASLTSVVPERGTALIEALLLKEAEVDYCGFCPGMHGEHKMSCAKTKSRMNVPVTVRMGSYVVTGPLGAKKSSGG